MRKIICLIGIVAFASTAVADVFIDFDDASVFTTEIGYRTKLHSVYNVADASGTGLATSFKWTTDGTVWYQYAYLCYDLGTDVDFTNMLLSFDYKKYNRSAYVGIELWDDGVLVKGWEWDIEDDAWTTLSISTTEDGEFVGTGLLAGVDEIKFFHKSGSRPASGLNYEVYFDNFSATAESVFLEGDANHDGVVSAGDYACVQANFGSTGAAGILGDANGDGVVSAGDYASVQANFGNTAGTAITPEPATVSLLVLCGAMLFRRKK